MEFTWNDDKIRLMADAYENESYVFDLLNEIKPYLPEKAKILEGGCGLGYLSMALAPFAEEITANDIDETALSYLSSKAKEKGISNIKTVCSDFEKLPEECLNNFDVLIFCFFGGKDCYEEWAKKYLKDDGIVIVINRMFKKTVFENGLEKEKAESFIALKKRLEDENIPFISKELSLSFGQPLRNLDDAKLYLELYKSDDRITIDDNYLSERVISREDPVFPYYIPHKKLAGLAIFKRKDIHF